VGSCIDAKGVVIMHQSQEAGPLMHLQKRNNRARARNHVEVRALADRPVALRYRRRG
jgi:hypothetical protein